MARGRIHRLKSVSKQLKGFEKMESQKFELDPVGYFDDRGQA